jgi:membrane protease YdiL (CAAX protease family)
MKKSAIFLLLTFFVSWTIAFCAFSFGVRLYTVPWLIMAIIFMCTPMISAIITQKFIFHESIAKPLGISFRINRWFIIALLFPAVLAIAATGVSVLFPGVSFTLDPTEANVFSLLENIPGDQRVSDISFLPVHPFILTILGGTLAGLTINGIAGFGEELGWRGLLLRESISLGFWKSSLIIGIFWGLWHLPFIVNGYNYPGHPVAGVFMMTSWTILFSPIIAYVCIRSNSVISAAIMHGAINGTAIAPAVVLKGGDSLMIGVLGLAGIIVLVILNLLLIFFGKPSQWHNKRIQATSYLRA